MRGPLSPRVGLVLGGGAARGLAHLGVLKVLEAERVPVDLIVGCSMGAMVGTLYALYGNARDAELRMAEFTNSPHFKQDPYLDLQTMTPLESDDRGLVSSMKRFYKMGVFFATTLFRESYIDPAQFEHDVGAIIPDCLLEESPTPIALVATDLASGQEVVLTSGPARKAVQASSAIAGIFPPVQMDGKELVDGGFADKVPVEVAFRLGADVVIAVDVSSDVQDSQEFSRRGTAISTRAGAITAETLKRLQMRFADVVIRPGVQDFHWADFAALAAIVPKGEEAARASLPAIRRSISRGRWKRAGRLVGLPRRWRVDLRA